MRLLSKHERPSSEIVIIGVDDQSLERLEPAVGRWPWPRAVFAGLIDYCSEAKTIVVDILFSEADSFIMQAVMILFRRRSKKAKECYFCSLLGQSGLKQPYPNKSRRLFSSGIFCYSPHPTPLPLGLSSLSIFCWMLAVNLGSCELRKWIMMGC